MVTLERHMRYSACSPPGVYSQQPNIKRTDTKTSSNVNIYIGQINLRRFGVLLCFEEAAVDISRFLSSPFSRVSYPKCGHVALG